MGKPQPPPPQPAVVYYATDYVLLPPYRSPRPRSNFCFLSSSALLLLLSALAVFLLWPSDPAVLVVRLHLDRLHVSSDPRPVSLDVVFDLTVRIRNRDFFSLDYDSLLVSIGYRGRPLGSVFASGGHIRARASSYVDATLRLDGVEVLHDVLYLIEDIACGAIPFDTVTSVKGKLGFFFFRIPIMGRVSCEAYVGTVNKTVVHQDCYPE